MTDTATRIYRINDGRNDRLVRAASQAQAVRHVTSTFAVRVATQADLVTLLGENATVEVAGEPQPQLDLLAPTAPQQAGA